MIYLQTYLRVIMSSISSDYGEEETLLDQIEQILLPVDDATEATNDDLTTGAFSLPKSVMYADNKLRGELISLGFTPGPILDTNRMLYLKKLQALKKCSRVHSDLCARLHGLTVNTKTYSIEIEKSLSNAEWMSNLSPYIELESRARADFADSSKKWREGTAKTSFTYLLLDPRLTDNLPSWGGAQTKHVSWLTFVNSIFYVGKGKRSRPYLHLHQALTLWKNGFKTSKDKNVQHILDIWKAKVGVVCLHIFQNVIPTEASTYEAAMIDALSLTALKNLKCGNYYGVVYSWPLKERRMLGQYLLYKAMKIFFIEGERQLRPEDFE